MIFLHGCKCDSQVKDFATCASCLMLLHLGLRRDGFNMWVLQIQVPFGNMVRYASFGVEALSLDRPPDGFGASLRGSSSADVDPICGSESEGAARFRDGETRWFVFYQVHKASVRCPSVTLNKPDC